VTGGFLERLAARSAAVGSVLCLGIDPDPAALPPGFSADIVGVEAFACLLVEAASPYASAVKPNLAFFEAFGSAGIAALERIRAVVPDDLPFIADAKRGDIGSTAARQAVALFDRLGADAITVNPYLGSEAIAPLLERTDRFAYVLCRTSCRPIRRAGRQASPSTFASRAVRRPGDPVRRPASSSARPHRRRSRRSGRSRPISPSSCQASARRAETWRQYWPMDRREGVPQVSGQDAASS
jgi:orotidine-5'-phosphate decarboxylase